MRVPKTKPFDAMSVPLQNSNLIEASAGTGKTYSIAVLTLRLVLEKQLPVQQILMVTFTKAAVAELETRIRQFLRSALKASTGAAISDPAIASIVERSVNNPLVGLQQTQRLLNDAVLFLDETAILTIHGFCQRVLTEFAFETGQLFKPEILTAAKPLLTDRVNAFWRKYITTLKPALLTELTRASFTREGLVKLIENILSGKVLSLEGDLPPGFFSASYLSGVAEDLRAFDDRVSDAKKDLEQYVRNNAAAIRTATMNNSHARKNFADLLGDASALIEAIVSKSDRQFVTANYADILARWNAVKAVEEEKRLFIKVFVNRLLVFAGRIIEAETDRYKEQQNLLAFDDMIRRLHRAVVAEPNAGLVEALRRRYGAAFIDEFQDTDRQQYEIFDCLFGNGTPLFYIGDPKQSIYSWRKADIFTYFKAARHVNNLYGMNTNYRSSPRFIEAMNQFFLPRPSFDSFSFSGEADAISYIPVVAPAGAKGELLLNGQHDAAITIFEDANNESIANTVSAQIIRLLSGNAYSIYEERKHRPVRPADIGILVRTNKQGRSIKRALSKVCIPAVTIDDTKLLQTEEAKNLLYLLEAAIDINASSINKALLSPFTGYTIQDILTMDEEWALGLFKKYQQLWEQEGIYVMLARFIADYEVKQVLLHQVTANGERMLTNLLQLMELLHKTQTRKSFSSFELANWLKRGIDGMAVEGDEFEQRVESDEEAVKIVTIHKSKGLEYKIVFAPFLDFEANLDKQFVTYREAGSGDYVFADPELMTDDQKALSIRQLEQENRRLLYVAITRAVYKCYINKSMLPRYSSSALAPFVDELRTLGSPLVSFERAQTPPEGFRYAAATPPLKPVYREAKHFVLTEVNWRKLSYTYLDPAHTPPASPPVLRSPGGYEEFVLNVLARGAYTGNLLHYIFEHMDFAEDGYWHRVIEDSLRRFIPPRADAYRAELPALLKHVTGARIDIAGDSFSLQELSREKRLNELEFDFNVALFDVEDFNALSSEALPFRLRFAHQLEGMMNGKIDLFFEHDGRFYILDWKSNFLGYLPADYAPSSLWDAMTEANYHLQYLIYTVAVKKYLQLHIPNFDFERQFGGVVYLFVRGVRAGSSQGVFTTRPPRALVDRLESLLAGLPQQIG